MGYSVILKKHLQFLCVGIFSDRGVSSRYRFELVIGLPNLPFDLAENINDFPNSMKCVVDNNIANAYLHNTLVKQSESCIYFVVKSDICIYACICAYACMYYTN